MNDEEYFKKYYIFKLFNLFSFCNIDDPVVMILDYLENSYYADLFYSTYKKEKKAYKRNKKIMKQGNKAEYIKNMWEKKRK